MKSKKTATPATSKSIEIAPGLTLVVERPSRFAARAVAELLRLADRAEHERVIQGCIERVIAVGDAGEMGLTLIGEIMGWHSSTNRHTVADVGRALLALLPTVDDELLVDVRSVAAYEAAKHGSMLWVEDSTPDYDTAAEQALSQAAAS